MKHRVTIMFLLEIVATVTTFGQAEEKESKGFTVDVGADLVSTYVWRGMYQSGASFQPAVNFSMYGLTLGAWGSSDFSNLYKEIDFTLSYEINRFSANISDFWWSGEGESYFKEGHHFVAGLGYTLAEKFPLSLGLDVMLLGEADKNGNGKQYYSTYISASYPFSIKNMRIETGIGISPWKGMYSDNINIAVISAKVSKHLPLTSCFALPVFVELTFAPVQDNAYLVFGLTF